MYNYSKNKFNEFCKAYFLNENYEGKTGVTDLFVLLPHQAQRTPSPGLTWALIEHTCTSLASNHPSST